MGTLAIAAFLVGAVLGAIGLGGSGGLAVNDFFALLGGGLLVVALGAGLLFVWIAWQGRAINTLSAQVAALQATPGTTEPAVVAKPERRRTARKTPSPFGDVHEVIDVQGIGETYATALNEIGITDTQELWQADPESVARDVDAPVKTVRAWQSMAELMALNGIGPQYAELLVRSGVGTIQELAASDVGELTQSILATEGGREVRIQGNVIGEKVVSKWVKAAQAHVPGTAPVRR